MEALIAFQKLAAAKSAEIAAATKQKDAKTTELADLMDKAAKAKEDIGATTNALNADEKFLQEAIEGCKYEEEEYAKRARRFALRRSQRCPRHLTSLPATRRALCSTRPSASSR